MPSCRLTSDCSGAPLCLFAKKQAATMGMCIANDAMCIHRYDDIIVALQIIHKVFFQKARHNPIATKYYPAQMRSMRKSIRRNKARAFDYDLIQEEGIFERVTIDQHQPFFPSRDCITRKHFSGRELYKLIVNTIPV